MAMERFFPVTRQSHNFFDQMMAQMNREFQQMELEMKAMRERMFHLVPMERSSMDLKDLPAIKSMDDKELAAIKPMESKLPLVSQDGAQSNLKLQFNVQEFKPEEVVVKVVANNILQVEAKQEIHTDTSDEVRSYFRRYQLPTNIDTDRLKPTLTKDGVLTIEAPAPALQAKEKTLTVEVQK